jgi:hypothetical protein
MNKATVFLAAAGVFLNAAEASMPDLEKFQAMTERFAPVEISADVSLLPEGERRALGRLVKAARIMDALFLRQVWAGNETLLLDLLRDRTPLGRARLDHFLLNKGPWSRLDHNAGFIAGVPPKPAGGGFYPAGSTRAEVEAWLRSLPPGEESEARGFFTVIRRAPGGRGPFTAVPYSLEYQGELALCAGLLREAAGLTAEPTLRAFLEKRAEALLDNDYYASDLAWMGIEGAIEPTIGPYEVYEDEWFNAKAAFEAFIAVRDEEETRKLGRLGAELQEIEDHLPVDPRYRNPKLGAMAPIRVVNLLFASGDGNRGVQTAAFNLPNDERVIREKGAKRVMLRNVQRAKFDKVLAPIAAVVLAPDDAKRVRFEAFFTHTVLHELMHGLGPHRAVVGGEEISVRQALSDAYSAIEEAKADISGLFALGYLADKGVLDRGLEESVYDTFLASAFRSIRFGINEAHGRGIAVQLNFLLDYGAFETAGDGTFRVKREKIREGVRALTREILTIEAEGDAARARDLLERQGVLRPEVRRMLDRLKSIPVDIAPEFVTARRLEEEYGRKERGE